MNDYLFSAVLGVVEGLTEFLPVSSTAHIRLTQALLKGEASLESPYWKLFAVVIQLPAIFAVVVYFRHRLLAFIKSFIAHPSLGHPVILVGIACVMTIVPAVLAKKLIKGNLSSLYVMGTALLVGGVVMWVVDALFGGRGQRALSTEETESDRALAETDATDTLKRASTDTSTRTSTHKPREGIDAMKPWQAGWIGSVQVLAAIFPGTSRSMCTIAAGQVAGLTRTTALEFSFFLSIPIMLAAVLKDLKDSLDPKDEAYIGAPLTHEQLGQIAIGSVVSFAVALLVIAWFMNWVRRRGFTPFAIYRILIGLVVLGRAWQMHHR